MTTFYNHQEIESKWQKIWVKGDLDKAKATGKKKYVLDMFPYPSADGLHVGHPEGYTATDIISRYYRLNGFNVLHPIGWDAFGLPTENFAIKMGVHPKVKTAENIATFKRQLQMLGFSYDWSREVNTSSPEYYKWTQWLFLQLYKKGLAYKKEAPVNWCPSCQTVLANEQVEQGKCERCGTQVIQKNLAQWFFKVTAYAEELLSEIDKLDWSEALKTTQKNWIGKSEGALIKFQVTTNKEQKNSKFQISNNQIEVFTTRPDTLFGATYIVLAPEHPLLISNPSTSLGTGFEFLISNWDEVEQYINQAKNKNQLERTELNKEKTGVELKGVKAINPATGEEIPVWVADYVLGGYGTGAIMCVPAHDERDFEFAKKFNLPIKQVIAPLFSIDHGPDAVRSDKKTVKRRTAYAFVKHWQEDKYLCLDWGKLNWHSGIIGGVNEGEDMIEAAKREIIEETGYQHVRLVKQIGGEVHNNFFAGHKDENRYAYGNVYLFELIDDAWVKPDPNEVKNHETIWVEGKKMKEFLNLQNFVFFWDQYLNNTECYTGEGVLINSGKFDGLSSAEAKDKITKQVKGKKEVQYKIRDWLVSRQRYWGAPIPIIYCDKCGQLPVPEKDLPVLLPDDVDFKPTGESPLARSKSFNEVKCPKCGSMAKREVDTMDTFVCSSWYFLRYCDAQNNQGAFAKKLVNYFMPVDLYVGGMEHAVGHLIYARFITKVLRDQGHLDFSEPFIKIRNQGIILAEDSRKMSKRWGNVINPDEVVEQFGADTMRMYEMFMGPLEDAKPWNKQGIMGIRRFLEKVYKFILNSNFQIPISKKIPISKSQILNTNVERLLHKTIKKVTEDIESLRFNTAISAMMILVNHVSCISYPVSKQILEKFLIILSPFAPHLAEELWEKSGHKDSIFIESWPTYDSKLIIDEEITLAIQVNGKVRDEITVAADIAEAELKELVLQQEKIVGYVKNQPLKKFIYIKGRLVNIVI